MSIHLKLSALHPLAMAVVGSALALAAPLAQAASSKFCEGGGFSVVRAGQPVVSGDRDVRLPAGTLGQTFTVRGRYVQFQVVAATFGIQDYRFLASNAPGTQTVGGDAPVFEAKIPDHRGRVLAGDVLVEIKDDSIELSRTGTGLSMKIQAKDCTQGGLFQMEPERADGTATRIRHVLAAGTFYFDNPNFRAREGDVVPFNPSDPARATTVTVAPRINWANDISPVFVGRDSAQVATRVIPAGCDNQIRRRDNTFATVQHCGRESIWDVASGGRMGMVTGEDGTEVAPPPTNCVQNCQAQNRVRGGAVVLGFPFPVPADVRLRPDFSTGNLTP
ncbi:MULTISPECIES: hypothetical protein [Ramlibacter]|uniref:hypothetical protein n=1 Tax=Ramlibacter TaxID=174951 RepID=UPI0015EF258E|nr:MULTISPECIES: hypothetical protein [Ramlibacter]MBA2961362.1 hypothetical protein [Ramlibacter sp. CGMCC 1.13660]